MAGQQNRDYGQQNISSPLPLMDVDDDFLQQLHATAGQGALGSNTITQPAGATGGFFMQSGPIAQGPLNAAPAQASGVTPPFPLPTQSASAPMPFGQQVDALAQAPQVAMQPPRTQAGQFLSHSDQYLQSQSRLNTPHMQSMPSVLQNIRTVKMKDENGVEQVYSVNHAVWQHMCTLLANGQSMTSVQPVFRFGIHHRPSVGSLPSAESVYSSQSSVGSTTDQAVGTPSTTSSVDPVVAIREQCQKLIQMGCINEVAQLTQELNIFAQGQFPPTHAKFSEEVSTCNSTFEHQNDADVSSMTNTEDHLLMADKKQVVNSRRNAETYSVNCPKGSLVNKPKLGFVQKVNLVIRRMFHSKL